MTAFRPPQPAAGSPRILVVEDEMLVAMLVEDLLADEGCDIVGPANSLKQAQSLAELPIDGAVLDVNLGGEEVYPVADALTARSVPIVFVTGYGRLGLRNGYRRYPTIQKPVDPTTFARTVLAELKLG